jgi:hypothetical protein
MLTGEPERNLNASNRHEPPPRPQTAGFGGGSLETQRDASAAYDPASGAATGLSCSFNAGLVVVRR